MSEQEKTEPKKDLITCDDPDAELCVAVQGTEHDYRRYEYTVSTAEDAEPKTVLRCVWCHVVSCGEPEEPDPCIEGYHHKGNHRTAAGVTWKLGGDRPR